MKLRQLFESKKHDAAIIFGRFNPPHFGHSNAWTVASHFPIWYVGTNQSTQGPKDPLPFEVKVEAMKTIMPGIADHLVAEQSWWTLATMVYKKHGGDMVLHVVTDPTDKEIFVPQLQKYNGSEGPHGFYQFQDIVWAPATRDSTATALRAAVANDNPQAFSKAAGIDANTMIAGQPFFELVKHYMTPYLHASAEKERQKAEKERQKAEKETAKAAKKTKTVDPIPEDNSIKKTNQIVREMRAHQFIKEGGTQPIHGHHKAAIKNATTFPSMNQSTGSAYMGYRMGVALAGAPDYPTKQAADNWIGGDPLLSPYTDEENEMINAAAKQVGGGKRQTWSNNRSLETADTNKTSAVAKIKKNKYGV